jgi:hypothetical protein
MAVLATTSSPAWPRSPGLDNACTPRRTASVSRCCDDRLNPPYAASTSPSSSSTGAHGAPSKTSSWQRWRGSTGGTPPGCTPPSATFHWPSSSASGTEGTKVRLSGGRGAAQRRSVIGTHPQNQARSSLSSRPKPTNRASTKHGAVHNRRRQKGDRPRATCRFRTVACRLVASEAPPIAAFGRNQRGLANAVCARS